MGLVHLGCPSCGGTLSLVEGQRLVACQYCKGQSLVSVPGAVPRYAVRRGVSQEQAREAALGLLAAPILSRALRERARIQEVSLSYVPFYEFTGIRLGTFLLRERDRPPAPPSEGGAGDAEEQGWRPEPPVEREDTRVIQQDYIRIAPACELPDLGTDRIALESLRRGATPVALEPFNLVALQSQAVVFAPAKTPQDFAADSRWQIKARGDRTALVEQRLKVLYYPVWQARYLFRGRAYEIAVDGVTGKVLRGRAPADMRPASVLAVAGLALTAVCFGRLGRQVLMGGLAGGGRAGWVVGGLGAILTLLLGGTVAAGLGCSARTSLQRSGEVVVAEEEGGYQVLESGAEGLRSMVAGLLGRPKARDVGRPR